MFGLPGGGIIVGDAAKLQGVADGQLVAEANRIAAEGDFLDGDSWQALCLIDPDRALRGLDVAATKGDWSKSLWHQLLWAQKEYTQPITQSRIAQLLLNWPANGFDEIASAASYWLDERAKSLDEKSLWPLWDRIADASLTDTAEGGHE
jgi:hypothetical protein